MYIGLMTDSLSDLPFAAMLKTVASLGIKAIELGTGNWSKAAHVPLDRLLKEKDALRQMQAELAEAGVAVAALNCSGNILFPGQEGERQRDVQKKTYELAERLGVTTVVEMSGLPGAGPHDEFPNWIVTSWPPETQSILAYQWETAARIWEESLERAEAHGIRRIALEPHGWQLVNSVERFRHLKSLLPSDRLGFNLDPSHLFWMGADPLAVAGALGSDIFHVHVKDVRIEPQKAAVNTLLDTKTIDRFAERAWNFSIPGDGHDRAWWRRFVLALQYAGYTGVLSIEHEDVTLPTKAGLKATIHLLTDVLGDTALHD